ncbi:MAG: beta-ketoacyl synthase [Eudoraea sp.]|nr:beta-ketoacyl synthase [Eudoraea sp.]NNJ40452.1 beta-ketoacyl synthase [Eudoraea sp.]
MDSPKISITAIASASALGHDPKLIWENYRNPTHLLRNKDFEGQKYWVAPLASTTRNRIASLLSGNDYYNDLDPTVLFALYVSRLAVEKAGWKKDSNFGINFGSSRGATVLFEKYHAEYLKVKKASTRTSPNTTLGNISSWVAHDLQTGGPEISHSITCSTALHAMLNGIAWIRSGMTKRFLVGGSEAALTPFTLAQMQALKIYSTGKDPYPCRALDPGKESNSMVLGEGAGAVCLEAAPNENTLAEIAGIGYATEPLEHSVSLSTNAFCFQRSMKMAMNGLAPGLVDVVVMHAPGTLKGDRAELHAIYKIFGPELPALTTNKWKIGHTFGASGILSVEMAIMMMQHQQFISVPYLKENSQPAQIRYVMVNAVGFGGNAVSILLKKPG